MERRDVLKYTALLAGASVSAPLISVILSGCNTDPAVHADPGQLAFFSPEEFALLTTLTDLILPKTDSPAASDVGVPQTIDSMVGNVFKEEDKENFRKGFDALSGYLKAETQGRGISGLEPGEQLGLLQKLEGSTEEKWEAARSTFLSLKQQTIAYYLSTKEIATKYLTYLPVPGEYKACISLEEAGGKAWAL
ncbi:MAG: gluconate 2-dehydrogenase subunit 3 family protein [Phaeodactylibacter sp.]|nr:gluconate 2-dehydrogenase subunit 3 family protein [Phaeodactylibacter sp.]MCB9264329.1 gluconate 2-dehydrogenase subunit 3 family protein [Lewinellaceae bacterium]MCB9286083.1 gluconate 2-dehydrogenase subunit 3 family protein [Lewinellaceae bacterium]